MQPQPFYSSSGDLIADRRYEWARDLAERGDFAAAADLLRQTVDIVPDYGPAWFLLGEMRLAAGDRDGAIVAFTRARDLDPNDHGGASLHLMRLGVEPVGDMPPAYVRSLFDGYAPAFDRTLVDHLAYAGPGLLLHALATSGRPMRFRRALDLGCGTGLAAAAFRPHCETLVGVDLSGGMLAKARDKGLYDRLVEADIAAFLREATAQGDAYDLVLAADVFVYLNELAPVIGAAARAMNASGCLAFTVETHDGAGVILRDTLRYAHDARHVRDAIRDAGLALVSLAPVSTRTEKKIQVPGLVAVAARDSS